MTPRLMFVALAAVVPASCALDWDRYDPRLATGPGGAGGSTTSTGGSGGAVNAGGGGAGGGIATTPDRFRSVGPGNTQALAAGSAGELTITGITATFSGPLPDNVGVGDVIQYDADGDGDIDGSDALAFVHVRVSSTELEVRDASGGVPLAAKGNWSVFRAYTALADAMTGTENTAITDALRDFDTGPKNLVAANEVWQVACYADAIDTRPVLVDGWTTSAVNHLRIFTPTSTTEVGTSQRHTGIASTGYLLNTSTATPLAHAIKLRSNHTRLEGVEVTGWLNEAMDNSWEGVSVDADGIVLDALLVHSDLWPNTLNPNGDAINLNGMLDGWSVTIRNSIIYDISRGGILYQDAAALIVNIDNCTVYNTATSGLQADGQGGISFINSSAAVVTVTNTISVETVTDSVDFIKLGDNRGSSSNNISSDATAPGANSLTAIAAANLFVSTTAAAENLHLEAGAAAINAGVDRPDFSVDIDGDPRPAGVWDIGADER